MMSPKTDLSWKRAKSVHKKLNTKEFCFLCLKSTKIKVEDDEELEEISTDHSHTKINQPVSLLCVRRHLKLNLTGILKNTLWDGSEEEIEVDLCNDCEKVIKKFSVLFQELEKVEMEMDYQLEKIDHCISEGAQSPELVQEYSKRMTSDVETLSQLPHIDKLRKEISQKCLSVRIGSYQKVEMPRIKIENINPSSLSVPEGATEDLPGEPDATYSPPLSLSLPTTYQDDEHELNCAETVVDYEVKLELHKNSKPQSSPRTFLPDSSSGKFCCQSCDKTYRTKGGARAHYESVHLNKTWKCDICNVILSKRCSNILRHKKNCSKMLQQQNERERSRQHYKFQCTICGKRFSTKVYLQKHQKLVHSKAKFVCATCTKTFKSLKHLNDHQKNIHSVLNVRCKYCRTTFKNYPACRYHQTKCPQRHLVKTEAKSTSQHFLMDKTGRFHCPSCTKTYSSRLSVRFHYNSVHLKKKFKCDLCNLAAFSEPNSLAKHKKSCLDTVQQRLQDRELRNSFQFECQACKKKFKSRKSLYNHKKAHSNIQKFQCDHCEKIFSTGWHLRNHRDSVHLKKTYPCKYCNKVLIHASTYYQHEKKCGMKNKGIKLEATGS